MTTTTFAAPSGVTYALERAGSGPTLLLLHGFTGSRASWRLLVDKLAPLADCLTIDLPGHGETTTPSGANDAFPAVLDDLARLLATQMQPPRTVLGYSMGGRLALGLAATHPELIDALVLESASPGIADRAERAARRTSDARLADTIERDGIEAFVDYWERLPLWDSQSALPAAAKARQRAIRLAQSPSGLADSLRRSGTGAQPAFHEALTAIAVPTLLIAGERDAKFVAIARAMHAAIPNSALNIVPGVGHAVHLEAPERYGEIVSQFLQSQATGDAGYGKDQEHD
ncbi:MAG: 2-succinyl-6-hydroxy-2,4-cyclohexadiene-1-carboxylate synthase [Thermomicrobiales bacterium]